MDYARLWCGHADGSFNFKGKARYALACARCVETQKLFVDEILIPGKSLVPLLGVIIIY